MLLKAQENVDARQVREVRPDLVASTRSAYVKALLRIIGKRITRRRHDFPTKVLPFGRLSRERTAVKNARESLTFSVFVERAALVQYRPSIQLSSGLELEGERGKSFRIADKHVAKTPDVWLYSLESGTITGGEGYIYDPRRNAYVLETMPRWFAWDRRMELAYRSARWAKKPTLYSGLTLSIAKRGGDNYYHFLHEELPSLLLFLERFPHIKLDRVLVSGPRSEFKIRWLKLVGVAEKDVLFSEFHSHLQFEQLLWLSDLTHHYSPSPLTVDLLGSVVRSETPSPNAEVFVVASRGGAASRLLDWENELAERYGGQVVDFAKLSPFEVISRCKQARVFAGAHGAAFANLPFCRPETPVYEIAPRVDHVLYSRLSSICGLNHHVVEQEQKDELFRTLDKAMINSADVQQARHQD